MNTHADKTQENQSKAVATNLSKSRSGGGSAFRFVDNRPEAIAQRKLQAMMNQSPQRTRQAQLRPEDEERLQGKFATSETPTHLGQQEGRANIPDNLKTGIENFSGMSIDDVKSHYNSSKPAQLNALPYTQGTDIHVAPGQEQHLPHEGWHVVRQMQGRVEPTLQAKGVSINDDTALEHEADVMGPKALQMSRSEKSALAFPIALPQQSNGQEQITQRFPISFSVRNEKYEVVFATVATFVEEFVIAEDWEGLYELRGALERHLTEVRDDPGKRRDGLNALTLVVRTLVENGKDNWPSSAATTGGVANEAQNPDPAVKANELSAMPLVEQAVRALWRGTTSQKAAAKDLWCDRNYRIVLMEDLERVHASEDAELLRLPDSSTVSVQKNAVGTNKRNGEIRYIIVSKRVKTLTRMKMLLFHELHHLTMKDNEYIEEGDKEAGKRAFVAEFMAYAKAGDYRKSKTKPPEHEGLRHLFEPEEGDEPEVLERRRQSHYITLHILRDYKQVRDEFEKNKNSFKGWLFIQLQQYIYYGSPLNRSWKQ